MEFSLESIRDFHSNKRKKNIFNLEEKRSFNFPAFLFCSPVTHKSINFEFELRSVREWRQFQDATLPCSLFALDECKSVSIVFMFASWTLQGKTLFMNSKCLCCREIMMDYVGWCALIALFYGAKDLPGIFSALFTF